MSIRKPHPHRRALLAGAVLSPLLAACGGGSGDGKGTTATDNTGTLPDGTPSYGGGRAPGSVLMVITHRVTMTTSSGVLKIGLDAQHAPQSVANFLSYVKSGAYVNTVFHRVMSGFVVQGGGFTDAGGTATAITTTGTVPLESRNGLSNTVGTLAMARASEPNSGSSQFYFNVVNNATRLSFDSTTGSIVQIPFLDYPGSDSAGYAVFGTLMDQASLDVVLAISRVPTGVHGNGMSDWPVSDVLVTAVTID